MSGPRIISCGGGAQSSALVVLAATHDPDFEAIVGGPVDAAVMANVGDNSEHPDAIEWVRNTLTPWAADRGFRIVEVQRKYRDGRDPDLLANVLRSGSRSIPIPVRMANGAPGRRLCTADWKIRVIAKWTKAHGASEADPATVAIGFSTDEVERVGGRRNIPHEVAVYPLIDLGMSRNDCQQLNVATFGRPAPKSSCWFCPFHTRDVWAEMRRDRPDLFWRSFDLERTINERRETLGKDHVYLTRFGRPLDEAVGMAQDMLPGLEHDLGETGCDEGGCFT